MPLVSSDERVESLKDSASVFIHRIRNLLNGIKMSLYILRRGASGCQSVDWADLERVYGAVETLLDRLQLIYKSQGLKTIRCPLGQLISDRLPTWRRLLAARGLVLDVDEPGEDPPSDFDPSSFTLGLDAFVSWRAEVAPLGSRILLVWRIDDDELELCWKEDGPQGGPGTPVGSGTPVGQVQAPRRPSIGVDSLALPLLARTIALHGGRLETSPSPDLRLTLRWPRFHAADP